MNFTFYDKMLVRSKVRIANFLLILMLKSDIYALIVPNEVPSLLSVIYSNIPTIKKGTDSRIGWGFRLGRHADFQVLLELGPQIYTQPLGNQPDKTEEGGSGGDFKRHAPNTLEVRQYAIRQMKNPTPTTNNKDNWLYRWRASIAGDTPTLGVGEIDAKLVLPPDDDDVNNTNKVLVETNV